MNPVHPVIAASKPFYLAVFCLKKKSGHQEVWTPMSIAHVYRAMGVRTFEIERLFGVKEGP